MASFDRGKKRQCLHCATKYYDLNRDPILCPSCGEVFVITVAKPAPVTRAPAKPDVAKAADATEVDPAAVAAGAEVISLDDAEDDDDDDDDALPGVEDVEVDDELAADETDAFLEEDEEDPAVEFAGSGEEKDET